jgi:hypothetical protein
MGCSVQTKVVSWLVGCSLELVDGLLTIVTVRLWVSRNSNQVQLGRLTSESLSQIWVIEVVGLRVWNCGR